MYNNKKVLAIIPARAGSKGIKNKNLADLNGKPLIEYTINSALNSSFIDTVLVSTDGENIAEFAKSIGASVPFVRPEKISGDKAKTVDAVFHAVEFLKSQNEIYDSVVLLQATSPFRTTKEIDEAIELYYKENKSVVAISKVKENPLLIRRMQNNILSPLLNTRSDVRRQDFADFYFVNGSIYINDFYTLSLDTSFNDNEIGYLTQSENIDIDTIEDLNYANFLMQNNKTK